MKPLHNLMQFKILTKLFFSFRLFQLLWVIHPHLMWNFINFPLHFYWSFYLQFSSLGFHSFPQFIPFGSLPIAWAFSWMNFSFSSNFLSSSFNWWFSFIILALFFFRSSFSVLMYLSIICNSLTSLFNSLTCFFLFSIVILRSGWRVLLVPPRV